MDDNGVTWEIQCCWAYVMLTTLTCEHTLFWTKLLCQNITYEQNVKGNAILLLSYVVTYLIVKLTRLIMLM
jgi:hypothetical protein